jgi:signal transduction histidine kinase
VEDNEYASRPLMPLSPRSLTLAAGAAGALTTLAVELLPGARFAYRSPAGHVALETAAGLTVLLAALLVLTRFRENGSPGDLGLVAALLLAAGSALLYVVPAVVEDAPDRFATWAPLAASLLAAAMFAATTMRDGRPLRPAVRRAAAFLAALGSMAVLGVLALIVTLISGALPAAVEPTLSPENAEVVHLDGHPAVITMHALGALCYVAAAAGLTLRAERTGDELMRWFAAGAALLVFARVNHVLFPSRVSDWLYTGDFLRLAAAGVLAYGAGREIFVTQRAAAVLEERRRMARELHDGLAQELAYIAGRTRELLAGGPPRDPAMLAAAAERALDESRRAVAALTQPLDEPLDAAIAREAESVAQRAGVRLRLELAERPSVPAPTREALLRIVREAITNAVRHSGATLVTVRLSAGGALSLEVADDGGGFDPDVPPPAASVGLRGMRERAEALGGDLSVVSRPGGGTTIRAVLPG